MKGSKFSDLAEDIEALYTFKELLHQNSQSDYEKTLKNIAAKLESLAKKSYTIQSDYFSQDEINNLKYYEKSIFELVLDSLIPNKIESEKINYLSTEEEHILSIVNNSLSLYELYFEYKAKYQDFISFINKFYRLEEKGLVTFSRKNGLFTKRGWIKLGELLAEGNILLPVNIEQAEEFKKNNKKMFIGEALVELDLLSESTLRESLKVQKWLSKRIDEVSKK